jgi:hypothetical protein
MPVLVVVSASAILMEPVAVLFLGASACVFTLAVTCVLAGFARLRRRRAWPILVGAATCLACLGSVMTTHWPCRISYALSRPSIERLAAEVLAGHPPDRPRRVGAITIAKAELIRGGVVCLWTETHPGGNRGLVRCMPGRVPFNLWSIVELDGRWQFIAED